MKLSEIKSRDDAREYIREEMSIHSAASYAARQGARAALEVIDRGADSVLTRIERFEGLIGKHFDSKTACEASYLRLWAKSPDTKNERFVVGRGSGVRFDIYSSHLSRDAAVKEAVLQIASVASPNEIQVFRIIGETTWEEVEDSSILSALQVREG